MRQREARTSRLGDENCEANRPFASPTGTRSDDIPRLAGRTRWGPNRALGIRASARSGGGGIVAAIHRLAARPGGEIGLQAIQARSSSPGRGRKRESCTRARESNYEGDTARVRRALHLSALKALDPSALRALHPSELKALGPSELKALGPSALKAPRLSALAFHLFDHPSSRVLDVLGGGASTESETEGCLREGVAVAKGPEDVARSVRGRAASGAG